MTEPPLHAGPEGPHAHPRKTGQARLDLVLAISAVFISGVSLYIAIEHGKAERDLVAANSWPFLRPAVSNAWGADHDLEFGFSNGGVGPAKVKSFPVFYHGVAVTNPDDLLRRCCGLSADPAGARRQVQNAYVPSASDEKVVRPGEELVAFRLRSHVADPRLVSRFDDPLKQLTYRSCYCSVFDECWTTRLQSTSVTRADVCPSPKVRFDPNGRG
jgi:hypothetical protein